MPSIQEWTPDHLADPDERDVAHLIFPDDVQTQSSDAPAGTPDGRISAPVVKPSDADVATAPDTTEVVEPGAADGGADEPVSTEPNEAGTAADPAVDTDAAADTDAATDTDTGTTGN